MKNIARTGLVAMLMSNLLASGCTTIQKSYAIENERMLLAAGFKKQMADTPELQQQIEQMQQGEVFSKTENDIVSYYYADAKDCQCLFTGTVEDFQRYRELKPVEYEAERSYNPSLDWYWP